MITALKSYPTYKPSGVEWLGDVPEHWTTARLKSSMNNIVEQTTERRGSDLYVALEHVESWTGRLRHAGPGVSFDSQVKYFRSGDILFGKLRPYLAKVTRPTSDGVCVGEFLVLRPRHSNATAPYMEQLLRSKPVIDAVNSSTFGAKMPRADWQFMGGMAIVHPPLPEQATIVRFLDHADRRIRRYIRAKEKLITLLEEQKQAIIHQAVTGQVDVRTGQPYPTYKPSGVEWLGDVPAHWTVGRLKDFGTLLAGTGFPHEFQGVEGEILPFYKVGDLSTPRDGRHMEKAPNTVSFKTATALRAHAVPGRAIVYAKIGAALLLNRRRIVTIPCLIDNNMTAYVPDDKNLVSMWAFYWTSTLDFRMLANPGVVPFLSEGDQAQLPIVIPPIVEQRAIVRFLDATPRKLSAAIAGSRRQIQGLREYRTRLIADVVTGKVDVRETAAGLPEVDPLAGEFDALTTQAAETGMMELGEATETPEELAMENEVTI